MQKGYYLAFLTAIISGFANFISKFGVNVINPYIFTWLKNLTVAFLLTGIILALKDWKILRKLTKQQWLLLIIIGLVGGSIPFLLFFKGLSLTNPAKASFVHKTMFVYVTLLSLIFLKEKIDKKFFFGGLFLVLGSLILFKKILHSVNQGDLLVFLATILWAVENTISKYILRSTDLLGRTIAWARMFFGSLFIFVFLLTTGQLSLLPSLNLNQISWVAIISVLLLAYVMTWYSGLKYIPVSQATVILLFGFPITTLLSSIWNKEIHIQELTSTFLIIVGIIFVIGLNKIWQLIREIKKLIYVRY